MMVTYNLPNQLTPFVGRRNELNEIMALLASPECRLLTLVGPGGIGKTRLALEAARLLDLREEVCEVYFIPLQGLSSPESIAPAIAESMGLAMYGGTDPQPQLIKALREQSSLLVMDNFEHLLAGAEIVSKILAGTECVKILATSREALNLQEEWLYTVQGMTFPPDNTVDGSALEDYSAVRLFLHHARRARADFSLEAEQDGILRICALVEGMPLGLELASVWVRSLSCNEIAQEIERSLDFLETPARNIPARHRSMRAVLDHSWKLLTETEQQVFRRLAVFRDGCTREAAEVVAGASLRVLSALVDKSLLQRDSNGRYNLHELVHQYAAEKLGLVPENERETHDQHSRYYTDYLYNQWHLLKGWGQKEALQGLDTEIENLRAAWDWAVRWKQETYLDRALHSLWFYYDTRSLYREGEFAFNRAANALGADDPQALRSATLGRVLARQGSMCYSLNRFEKGDCLYADSLEILKNAGARREMAFTLLKWAEMEWRLQKNVSGFRHVKRSLALYREANDEWGEALSLQEMGTAYLLFDHNDKARKLLLDSLAINRRNGNRWGMAGTLDLLSSIMEARGDFAEARQLAEESLAISQDIGLQWCIPMNYRSLGYIAYREGNYVEAGRYLYQALKMAYEFRIMAFVTEYVISLAAIKEKLGELERAVELAALDSAVPAPPWLTENAQDLLENAAKKLPAEAFQAALDRGRRLDLDETVRSLIEEYAPTVSRPVPAQDSATSEIDTLTEREQAILRLIADGLSNQEIADQLVLALSTIKWYINQIFTKLHVGSRTQAVARARELKVLG